jgi:hypothetical protein
MSAFPERGCRQLHARDQLHDAGRPDAGRLRRAQRPPPPHRPQDCPHGVRPIKLFSYRHQRRA